ncbi:MAG TPA: WYL domain-containing protein [Thermoanaerobaculia bacterium]|nr:WYL domain-containing protein [Thermoanaerobaculia bacterium]
MGRKGAFKDRPLWRRLQTIHHQIKDGRRPNASSLARELRVSTKTVQRDLDYLRDELDAPIEFDRGENGYAYSRSDYVLPFLPVDGKDLFSIGVAAQVMALFGGTPLARDLESCYERLAELMPPAVRLRPEIVRDKIELRSGLMPHRPVREETWQAVAESMERGVALSIRYRHPGEPPGEPRIVRPYAIVLSGRDWLAVADDIAAGQVKTFYLARMEGALLTSDRYAIPKNFDVRRYFRHTFGLYVGGERPFRFRVRFSREVADDIREQRWHPQQTIEDLPDGGAILELPAVSIREARELVLRYGKSARVLAPPELVADLRDQADALFRSYASEGKADEPAAAPRRKAARP